MAASHVCAATYLLFDAAYARVLIDIGYRDAQQRADEIEAFLRLPDVTAVSARAASRAGAFECAGQL